MRILCVFMCVLGNEVDGLARATESVMVALKMNGRVVTAESALGSENGLKWACLATA